MKLSKLSLLLLSSALIVGCNSDSSDDDSGDSGDAGDVGGTSYTNSALISDTDDEDTGELRLELDTSLAAGMLSVNVMYASDEDQTALVTIMGETSASTSYRMAEFKLDESYAAGGDGYVGIRLRDDATYDSSTMADIAAATWANLTLAWDTVSGTYDITVDGYSYGPFTLNEISGGGYENVGYVTVKIADNSKVTTSTTPLYIDDLTVYSDTTGTTEVFSDNFEDYDSAYVLGTGTDEDDEYSSSSFDAVVSDAQNATE